jgi:hypothetical protein
MPVTVVIDKAKPGIALSANEATELKKKLAPYVEASNKKGKSGPHEFKDDRRNTRKVWIDVTRIDGKTFHVELTDMT